MKKNLPILKLSVPTNYADKRLLNFLRRTLQYSGLLMLFVISMSSRLIAQGTWTAVTAPCPGLSGGVMLVLSDGTVICKSYSGGTDGIGNTFYKLTPDIHGSYVNGTWSAIAPMINTRLYFSSQVLKDGRVYVAGGEYGTGGSSAETYNPLTNTWTAAPAPGAFVSDANSEILEDGRVLQAIVQGTPFLQQNKIYNPSSNTYINGPSCIGYHNESSWVKLPDNSILFVDRNAVTSERYIPAQNKWVADANVPVALYDPYGLETGAGLLLPDGRAFFIGSTGHTAYYTPSGNNTPGTWAAGPDIPNAQGTPDAPAAMMVNGKILCAVSPVPTVSNHFPSPTSYYEFDYSSNSLTRINAPGGGLTSNVPCYYANMVDLPDGNVLYSLQNSNIFYVYTPSGAALAAGKPKIVKGKKINSTTYQLTGKGFNGISEGANYGDDWQMATNYPIVRLTSGTNVYYARTSNWNSTGVARGNKSDTTTLTLPAALPSGTYSVEVVANGIASNPVTVSLFNTPEADATIYAATDESAINLSATLVKDKQIKLYPNPAKDYSNLSFTLEKAANVSLNIVDLNGKQVRSIFNGNMLQGDHSLQVNTSSLASGIYLVKMVTDNQVKTFRLMVQQ